MPNVNHEATDALPADEIRQIIERAEAIEAQKKDLNEEAKEVWADAKGRGYDVKILKKIMALRARDQEDISEEEAVLALYKEALNMN